MKTKIQKDCRLLVESILSENLVDANDILSRLIAEAQAKREADVERLLFEQDEEGGDDDADDAGDDTGDEGGDEDLGDDDSGEPDDNDTDLGDDLEDAAEQSPDEEENDENVVGNAKLSELGNDAVDLQCQINEKMISIYADQLANMKTKLNSMGLDKQERDYVTLETSISYYSKKLRELQDKCEITVDQNEVAQRLSIIENAIKTLESQVEAASSGETDGVPDVEDTDEVNDTGEEDEGGEEEEEEGAEEEKEGGNEEDNEEGAEEGAEEDTEEGAEEGKEE